MIFKQKIEEIFQNFKKMHEKAGRVIENGQIAEEEVKEIMLISQDLEKAIESISKSINNFFIIKNINYLIKNQFQI